MPWGLKHFQQSGQLHFLTFSCYRRPKLRDSTFARVLRIVTGTRAPVLRAVRVRLCRDARTRTSAGQRTGTRLFSTDGKRVTTTSTSGARANLWKSYATSIATQSCADWWSGPRTGYGAASVTISQARTEWSRSNPNGQHGAEKNCESCRQLAFTKTPPKRSLSGAPCRVV